MLNWLMLELKMDSFLCEVFCLNAVTVVLLTHFYAAIS